MRLSWGVELGAGGSFGAWELVAAWKKSQNRLVPSAQLALTKLDIFLVFYLCYSDCLDLDLELRVKQRVG